MACLGRERFCRRATNSAIASQQILVNEQLRFHPRYHFASVRTQQVYGFFFILYYDQQMNNYFTNL
jgi:hypothetical protein